MMGSRGTWHKAQEIHVIYEFTGSAGSFPYSVFRFISHTFFNNRSTHIHSYTHTHIRTYSRLYQCARSKSAQTAFKQRNHKTDDVEIWYVHPKNRRHIIIDLLVFIPQRKQIETKKRDCTLIWYLVRACVHGTAASTDLRSNNAECIELMQKQSFHTTGTVYFKDILRFSLSAFFHVLLTSFSLIYLIQE